jgi:hypothetical protein
MATRIEMLQRIRREYRRESGVATLDHRKVAEFAVKRFGWRLPKPKDPIDILAGEISDAARMEERTDKKTGLPYRANLSYSVTQGNEQLALWIDTDEATRFQLIKSATKTRDQMVGEAYRLALTIEHWCRVHPDQEPYQVELDLGPDVEWLRNSPGKDRKTG